MSLKLNRWTPEEDALLEQYGDGPLTYKHWDELAAKRFPGRTGETCRKRYGNNQRAALGMKTKRHTKPRANNRGLTFAGRVDDEAEVLARVEAARLKFHPTITGHVFGDPLPGRSALDKRNGVGV